MKEPRIVASSFAAVEAERHQAAVCLFQRIGRKKYAAQVNRARGATEYINIERTPRAWTFAPKRRDWGGSLAARGLPHHRRPRCSSHSANSQPLRRSIASPRMEHPVAVRRAKALPVAPRQV